MSEEHRTERVAPAHVEERLLQDMTPSEISNMVRILRLKNKDFREGVDGEFKKALIKHDAEQMFDAYLTGDGPLTLVSEEEISERPAPEWWVESLIQKGTITVLAGPGGVGKSFLSLHIARCMALGVPAFMLNTIKGRVLYVIAEGANSFGKRARAWDDFHRMSPDGSAIQYVEEGVNLSSEVSVSRLCEVVKEGEFDLIILDTWSQLSHIEDENSSAKTAHAMRQVKRLRDAREGSSVLVVHHTDAKATRARGSTAVRDNSDTTIMIKPQEGGFYLSTDSDDGGKQKDNAPLRMDGFKLESRLDSAVVTYTGIKHQSPYWQPLRDLLSDGNWHSGTDIRNACGIAASSGAAYQQLKTLLARSVKDGVLSKDGPQTRPVYKLTPIPGQS